MDIKSIRIDYVGGMSGGAKCLTMLGQGLHELGYDVTGFSPFENKPYYPVDYPCTFKKPTKESDLIICSLGYYADDMPPEKTVPWIMGPVGYSKLERRPKKLIAIARHIIEKYAPDDLKTIDYTFIPSLIFNRDFYPYRDRTNYDVGFCFWPRGIKWQNKAIEILTELSKRCRVCVIGKDPKVSGVSYLGKIMDHRKLVDIYNETDTWFIDNLIEGDSTLLHEAIACGTKVATFRSFWTAEMEKRFPIGFFTFPTIPPMRPDFYFEEEDRENKHKDSYLNVDKTVDFVLSVVGKPRNVDRTFILKNDYLTCAKRIMKGLS